MQKSYTWEYRLTFPPYDKVMAVLEAFYASSPRGEYELVEKQRYRLGFRRGQWRRKWLGLGPLVPDRLVKGHFEHWPILVDALVRPAPSEFVVTLRYQLHLPADWSHLEPQVQASVDQHIRLELADLRQYISECAGLEQQPALAAV